MAHGLVVVSLWVHLGVVLIHELVEDAFVGVGAVVLRLRLLSKVASVGDLVT